MIYLDYYAAAPLLPQAKKAMNEVMAQGWANASSVHQAGQAARASVEQARESVAAVLAAHAADIVLTSSGTEACNLGIRGVLQSHQINHIVTTVIEHPAVQECVAQLALSGVKVSTISPAQGSMPAIEDAGVSFDSHTLLAMQWINHETGAKLPVQDYVRFAKDKGAIVFIDAVAALASENVKVVELGADLLALSSPKIGGPTGAGALYVDRNIKLTPSLVGGMQERGRRGGTASSVLLAGFGAACQALPATRQENHEKVAPLRDRLEQGLRELGGEVNRVEMPRAPTVTNLSFKGWRSEWLVAALDLEGICVSAGAACAAGLERPSPSISAFYPHEAWRAASAIRLSLGPGLDSAAIDTTLQGFRSVLSRRPPQAQT